MNPEKTNYFNATLQGLITIGLDRETVRRRVKEISVQAERLEVIGLVVSVAHDTYEMYVRPKVSEDKIQGPFFFRCDCVAQRNSNQMHHFESIVWLLSLSCTNQKNARALVMTD